MFKPTPELYYVNVGDENKPDDEGGGNDGFKWRWGSTHVLFGVENVMCYNILSTFFHRSFFILRS